MSDPRFPYLRKPKVGFLLGKFMPPHNGHVFLCEFARQYVDRLVILVGSLPTEPIPGELRFKWMKELFPDCDVVWTNEVLPQEPLGPDDEDFWKIWKRVCYDAMRSAQGEYWSTPDVVFASEEYGHRLAKELNAEFVPVDMTRTAVPSSGTMMRAGPFEMWDYLPHVVRPYYAKRVCLFGPESTGKSTLATGLGKHYKTIVAPEYGRTYTEVFGPDVGPDDLRKIVQGHLASVAAAKRQANKILIEDTDPVMTAVWSDLLVGGRHEWFDEYNDCADLYLLTDVDLPWVDDGTRYFKNDDERRHFYNVCEQELINRGVKFARISGRGPARLEAAIRAIDAEFFKG
jgi:HTH-type transcriptional repressor of NAD biosynthesis genes